MWGSKGSLQRRITLSVVLVTLLVLVSLWVVSSYIIRRNIEDSLHKKLALSRLIRNNIDEVLKENMNRLFDISLSGKVDFRDGDFTRESSALATAFRYSIFTDGVFLVDKSGSQVLAYPEKMQDLAINLLSVEPISRSIALQKPIVSNIYTIETLKRKVLYVLVPLRDKDGSLVGSAGGGIDPTHPMLTHLLKLENIGDDISIDIVDSSGGVIASSDPSRVFTYCDYKDFFRTLIGKKKEYVGTCHQCHTRGQQTEQMRFSNTLVFVPLETAPWGVSVLQPQASVYAPVFRLRWAFIALSIFFTATALVVTVGLSRRIVNPIGDLVNASRRIADGDLSQAVLVEGGTELAVLGESFETMRMRLVMSLENIRQHNAELESRVRERTIQIRESRKRIQRLLAKVIFGQEDERKRIARELHDATLQELSAVLMKIDMCRIYPDSISREKIDEIRAIVLAAIEELQGIIQNLRPTVLDDLGLEAAIKRLCELNLREKGIHVAFGSSTAGSVRFRPEVEINIFRIVQEAIVNIARHANARNVDINIESKEGLFTVTVRDDGAGFDAESLLNAPVHDHRDGRGLGLLGMQERAASIAGKLHVFSDPVVGTNVVLEVPIQQEGGV